MFTEEEAKTKWCPFARLTDGVGATFNRCGPSANLECIGSACMAWRWWVSPKTAEERAKNNDCGIWSKEECTPSDGCGLAGRPE